MKSLPALLICLILAAPIARAAPPPASAAGWVFHEASSAYGIRDSWERSVQLNADGSYLYLKYAIGTAFNLSAAYAPFLAVPPAGGSYRYTVNPDSTATLTLNDPAGNNLSWILTFSSASAGTLVSAPIGLDGSSLEQGTFFVTAIGAAATVPMSNVSLRGTVGANHPLIAGFVVPGADSRELLIRVVGPGLIPFGIADAWAQPSFQLYQAGNLYRPAEPIYPNWSAIPPTIGSPPPNPTAAFVSIFNLVGAFALPLGSNDSAAVVRLPPGAYTVMAVTAGAGDPGGEALIEVYALP